MSQLLLQRPTISTIDLDNLAFNFNSVREFVGDDLQYLAVVKAGAYGHGAVECSRILESLGIDWLGVALPEEGVELRNAGIAKPILVLGSFWPGQEELVIRHRLTPVVFTHEQASLLDRAAATSKMVADYHVKIDTGMGRIGVRFDRAAELAVDLTQYKNIRLDGLMTHFAAADDLEQNEFTELQVNRFDEAVSAFQNLGFRPTYIDLANSPGAIAHPTSRRDMVRLGGVLYGLGGDVLPQNIEKPELRPVLSLTTRISQIKTVPSGETLGYGRTFKTNRDSVIATIPVGYADGYRRRLSNVGRVIVHNQFVPIVGRISMDWTIIDVTELPDVEIGDEVILIGRSGSLEIKAEDIAAATDTISYEITCGIGSRVPRRFIGQV